MPHPHLFVLFYMDFPCPFYPSTRLLEPLIPITFFSVDRNERNVFLVFSGTGLENMHLDQQRIYMRP